MKYLFLLAAFLCSLAFVLASYLLDILESSIIILINREDFRTLFVCSVLHYLYNFSFYTLTKFPVFFLWRKLCVYPENFQTTGDFPQVICALTKEQLQMCCSHDAFCTNMTCHLARSKYIHLLKQHYFNKVLKEPFAWKLNHPLIILFFTHIYIY